MGRLVHILIETFAWAFVVLLVLAFVLIAPMAHADRMFASEQGLTVPPVANAVAYEWERDPPAASTTITTEPKLRVFEPWKKKYRWRVRALPTATPVITVGFLPGPWSDWSELASWWLDVNSDGDPLVRGRDVTACAFLAGLTLVNGEWLFLGSQ